MDTIKEEDSLAIKTEMQDDDIDRNPQNQDTDYLIKLEINDVSEENVQIDPVFVNCKIEANSDGDNESMDCSLDLQSGVPNSMQNATPLEKQFAAILPPRKTTCKVPPPNIRVRRKLQAKSRLCAENKFLDPEEHKESVLDRVEYKCEQCDYKATRKFNLDQHIKSVHELSCKLCNFEAINRSSLNRHVNTNHTGIMNNNCQLCDYKTKYKHRLQKHIESVHIKGELAEYACKQCDYKTNRKDNLHQHVKSVHLGIKYQCEHCNHKASAPSSLLHHVKSVHEGNKVEYSCEHCDYMANRKDHLQQHVKYVHERIKVEYKCEQCDYKVSRKDNLRQHVKSVHLGIKYKCKHCDHKASSPSSLLHHLKSVHEGNNHNEVMPDIKAELENSENNVKSVHEGIKVFKVEYNCEQCDYKASRKGNLQQHVKSVHLGIKYKCKHCDHKASTPSSLLVHVKSVHQEINHKEVTPDIKTELENSENNDGSNLDYVDCGKEK